jgi:hypothetical protein
MRVGLSVAQKQMCQISGRGLTEGCQGAVYCAVIQFINTNGPAIWGGCVTRRSIRQLSWYPAVAGPRNCPGARRVWRTFCRHGTNFIEHYACRGTSMIGATNLSPVTMLVECTSAVSRYNLSRSQKSVKVQDLYYGLMRVSGCNNQYESVLSAGAKAKSVTNNLPILSVLGVRANFLSN